MTRKERKRLKKGIILKKKRAPINKIVVQTHHEHEPYNEKIPSTIEEIANIRRKEYARGFSDGCISGMMIRVNYILRHTDKQLLDILEKINGDDIATREAYIAGIVEHFKRGAYEAGYIAGADRVRYLTVRLPAH